MTTKKSIRALLNLAGLTISQIKAEYPNGEYKSGMRKDDIVKAALNSVKPAKTGASVGKRTER